MRPTDKTRNQDLARSQGDHSTLYVSQPLVLHRWLHARAKVDPEATLGSSRGCTCFSSR